MSSKLTKTWFSYLLILLQAAWPLNSAAVAQPDDRMGKASLFLSTITVSDDLQDFLEKTARALVAVDPMLQKGTFQVTIIDLSKTQQPRLAQLNGEQRVYPASVVKFIYLIAAYRWMEEKRIELDAEWQRHLKRMIRYSDNQSTRWIVYALTGTQAGAELPPASSPIIPSGN